MTAKKLPVVHEYLPWEHGARCDLCPLKETTFVPPKPSYLPTKVVFVGEAPGRKEEICLVQETLVLMSDLTWKPLGAIRVGDKIIAPQAEADDYHRGASRRAMRRWMTATVTARSERVDDTVRVDFKSGAHLIGTPDHRVLASNKRGKMGLRKWVRLSGLHALEARAKGNYVRHNKRCSAVLSIGPPWVQDERREAGWLAGFLDGEGHVLGVATGSTAVVSQKKKNGTVGFSQNAGPIADYAEEVVARLGFKLRAREEHRSYTGKIIVRAHIAGGFYETMRFLGVVRPQRLLANFSRAVDHVRMRDLLTDDVVRRSPSGKRLVVDITTTSGTFMANGFVVHNCGEPFKGMTGQFLRSLCREVDIDFREAALQNASLCRSELDRENDEAAICCAPRLLKELAAHDPSIPIVTLGKSSTLSVLGVRSILRSRGFVWTARQVDALAAWSKAKKAKTRGAPKWKELWLKAQIANGRSQLAGRTVFPTVHPAFVLRSDTWLPILKIDLDRVARWLRGELTREMLLENGPYVVVTKREDVRRELKKFGPDIDVDVETGASKDGLNDGADPLRNRLLCVGISDGEHTICIWPWRKATHAPLLNALLKRSKSIGMHNGYNFDQLVLNRYDVPFEPIDDKLEDTLIAHHTFASHMPQRLAHVASVFVDVGPWKITFKQGSGGATEKGLPPEKLDPKDLTKYNCADARVQARVRQAMRADLESELSVYEIDKMNARLTRGMIIDGIGVDLERRERLLEAMDEKEGDLLDKMRVLLRRKNFHPMQLNEVRKALFTTLRAPLGLADPTDTGLPSTSQKTLERLKTSPTRAGQFADLLLQWRGVVKIKSTYLVSQVLDG